jgi:16S rRNA processing protein RimM
LTSSTPDLDGGHWLRAGTVGRPHGLDGSFYVIDPSPGLLTLGTVVLVGARELTIERRAGTDQRPILRLRGHSDRTAAEALRGRELMVARTRAAELEPDEWWAEDLVGCSVSDGDRLVGTVSRLLSLPSCEVLEVTRDAGPAGGEGGGEGSAGEGRGGAGGPLLVPLVTDAVRQVDVERRTIDIDLRFLGEE